MVGKATLTLQVVLEVQHDACLKVMAILVSKSGQDVLQMGVFVVQNVAQDSAVIEDAVQGWTGRNHFRQERLAFSAEKEGAGNFENVPNFKGK